SLVRLQKALIIVDPNKLFMQTSSNNGEQEMHFFFPMENTGTTPTRSLAAHINRMISPTPMPKDFTYPDIYPPKNEPGSRNDLVPVIGPKDSRPMEAMISRQQYEMWTRHEVHLYFYGWAEYNDIFDKTPRHITRFCYEAFPVETVRNAAGQQTNGVQLAVIGTFFNCYDGECKAR
ncbi:MAG TPA: hypothetical protein VI756_28765, partial [Blastocatellia bacterium]